MYLSFCMKNLSPCTDRKVNKIDEPYYTVIKDNPTWWKMYIYIDFLKSKVKFMGGVKGQVHIVEPTSC